jgi:hypothetical protein
MLVAMKPLIAKGEEIFEEKSANKDYYDGWLALAGYYDSLGPDWKKWADHARKEAKMCIQYCSANDTRLLKPGTLDG